MDARDCICFHLKKAARAAARAYDDALAPAGLRNTQFALLALLDGYGALPVSRLAELAVMERTTLTRNLTPLERQKLVASGPGEDRRQRIVRLTAKGRKKLAEAQPLWRRAQKQQVERLGATRKDRLLADLRFAAEGKA